MKILFIIQEELKRSFRNINVLLIMTLMPIILILILGLVFNGEMGSRAILLEDIIIEYSIVGEPGVLSENVKNTMLEVFSDDSSEYYEAVDKDSALKRVENAEISCFLEINENNQEITIYKNSLDNMESSLIEGVLGTFVSRANAISEIIKVNPIILSELELNSNLGEYTVSKSLAKEKSPRAMDYYGIVEVTLFVLYGVMTPFYGVYFDRTSGIGDRILGTPIKKREYFLGKFFGSLCTTVIQMGIVIFVSTQVFGVNWGENPIWPFLLIFTQIIAITSIGISFGFSSKNENAATTIIHLTIAITGFFGGAYTTLAMMGSLGKIGKYFSLLWWNNTGIINYIFLNDKYNLSIAFLINLLLALVFFLIAMVRMNKTESFKNE